MNTFIVDPLSYLEENTEIIYKEHSEKEIFLFIKINSSCATCPNCKISSSRSHSRYCRNVDDIPMSDCHFHFQIIEQKCF